MAKGGETAVLMQDEYGDMEEDGGETWIKDELELESGRLLHRVPVRYKTWGALNAAGDNVLVVCHALTGNGAHPVQAKASPHPNHAAHSQQRSVPRLSIGGFVAQWTLRHGGQRCSVQAELSTQTGF
jgi:hypothetical protein